MENKAVLPTSRIGNETKHLTASTSQTVSAVAKSTIRDRYQQTTRR